MKKRSIRQCIIKGHTWEHGYDKEELAKVLEELYPIGGKDGFSFTICGDTLNAKKSGEWIGWTLITKDGRKGEYKSLDYFSEDYNEEYFARRISYVLMRTVFDASLTKEQRIAEKYIEELLRIYADIEDFGIQMEGSLPKSVIQAGRKLINLSKSDRREALFFLFQLYSIHSRSGLNCTRELDNFAKNRIDWYLRHVWNR